MYFLRITSVFLIASLSGMLTSCGNKTENWLNDYAKTKCAYQQEQQIMQGDSVRQISSLVLDKDKLLRELAQLSEPYNKRIEKLNAEIRDERNNYMKNYRKVTDKHNEKYGHVSTPEYEKVIENLQIKRETKISSLQENINRINAELTSDSEFQNKSLQIELLESKIDSSWNSISGKHQPIIDSLQLELNTLNRDYKNILKELSQEEKSNFEMSRDNIRKKPCINVRH